MDLFAFGADFGMPWGAMWVPFFHFLDFSGYHMFLRFWVNFLVGAGGRELACWTMQIMQTA